MEFNLIYAMGSPGIEDTGRRESTSYNDIPLLTGLDMQKNPQL